MAYLPLGIGQTIIATNPFAITFLAHIFLQERAQRFEIAALVISFTGIAIMGLAKLNRSVEQKMDVYYTLGIALAVMAGSMILIEKKETPYFVYDSKELYGLILVAGVCNIMAMNLWQYSVQHCRSTSVALLRYVGVFYHFLFDLVVFHESFIPLQLVGAAIVVVTKL